MSGQLGELVISLQADIARFREDMGKASKIAQDSAKEMTVALDAIPAMFTKITGAAAGVAAILGGGAMFKDMITTTKEVSSEVVKLTKVFGITAEEASVMRVALDDAFLSVDDAVGASDRLTRAALKNGEAFDKAGINIRNSDGSLKDSLAIMMEVNDFLKTLKEGKERDSAAMALYGKGWREFSGILRLTSDGMKEAKQRAEDLHLIFGDDKVQAVKKYRQAMKDIDDVAESLKVQVGTALIPEFTNLAVTMGESATKFIPSFITGLHDVEAEVMRMAMLMDKVGGTVTAAMYYITGGKFTDTGQWWAEQNKMYQQRYEATEKELQALANLEVGLDRNGNPIKGSDKKQAATGIAPDMSKQQDDSQLWASAHDKYLAYLKAFSAQQAEAVKAAAQLELEINRQAYEWGARDLQAYLNTKHRLTEKEIQDEIDLKKKEVAKYVKEADDNRGTGTAKGAAAYHAALAKEAEAKKELIALEGKLKLTREQNTDESKKATDDQTRGFREQQAVFAELQNDFVRAAEIRRGLDESSIARAKLEQEAMTGDADAIKAYWSAIVQDDQKTAEAAFRQTEQYRQLGIQLLELAGHYEKAAKARKDLMNADPKFKNLPKEVQDRQNQVADNRITEGRQQDQQGPLSMARQQMQAIGGGGFVSQAFDSGIQHQSYLDQLKAQRDAELLTEKEYADQKLQVDKLYNDQKLNMAEAAASQLTDIVAGQFKDSIGVQLAALAIQEGISVSQIMMQAEVAKMGVMAAYAMVPGGAAIAAAQIGMISGMEATSIAITAAAGVAKAASIVAGKREGGGPVSSGSTYLVGEKGPELFTPGASGAITPNHALGGVTIQMTNHIDARGADQGVDQRIAIAVKQLEKSIPAAILNDMNRGGKFAIASGRMR